MVVVGVAFGGYQGYKSYTAKKTVTTAAAQYLTVTAKKMNLEVTIQGTGSAYAANTKDVMPNNNGTIKDLNVKIGDTVTAGQKLFVSDSDDVRRAVTTAQNNVSKQNLQLTIDQSSEKVDDNKIAMDNIAITDAKTQLASANQAVTNMTVTAPIGGVITAVNNTSGDSAQSGKAVLSIVDMSSMKVKVSVDELNIAKVKTGQKATVKFDAVKDKTYEGIVETIAETGTTSNNVTTYSVVVAVKDPAGIKLGMNANVTISVESKDNAIAVPSEAIITNNNQKFVRVETTDSSAASGNSQAPSDQQTQANSQGQSGNGTNNKQTNTSGTNSKLVAIKTGLEIDNYIEVTEGLQEGDKILVTLPKSSSITNNNKNNLGGLSGFGGDMGGQRPQGNQGGNNAPTAPKN